MSYQKEQENDLIYPEYLYSLHGKRLLRYLNVCFNNLIFDDIF